MAQIVNHMNTGYSGSIPLQTNDRYYAHDLARDFAYLKSVGTMPLVKQLGQDSAIIYGGIVSQGADVTHIDISAAVGIHQKDYTVPDSFAALPPTTTTAQGYVVVEMPVQDEIDISGATLDGSTPNYIKLKYKETDSKSRDRAKGSGSYYYEVEDDFEITIDTVSPTAKEVLLGSFVGNGVDSLVITQAIGDMRGGTFGGVSGLRLDRNFFVHADDPQVVLFDNSGTPDARAISIQHTGGEVLFQGLEDDLSTVTSLPIKIGNGWSNPTTPLLLVGASTGADVQVNGTMSVTQSGVNNQLIMEGGNGLYNTVIFKKESIDATHIRYALSHNGNDLDYTIYGYDGSISRNFIRCHWTENQVDLRDGLMKVGNPTGADVQVNGSMQVESLFVEDGMWFQMGSGLSISGTSYSALATLNSTTVAFIESNNDELRTYSWSGSVWTQVGSGLSISGTSYPALAALNSTTVAFIDGNNDELRTYSWSGSVWTQVGSGLSISGIDIPALAALNSTTVAFIDGNNEELRTYSWSGSAWTQVGSGLSISGAGEPALAALNSTTVAFFDYSNGQLRTYSWSGSAWTQVGSGLSISVTTFPALAALNSTTVAFIDGTNEELRTYSWSGSAWTQVGSGLSISGTSFSSLAALNSTTVAFIDGASEQLRTYHWM